jgi:RIO kinase 1
MTSYYGQFAPELLGKQYAGEIWELYEDGKLHPEVSLTGTFEASTGAADVDAVMLDIKAVLAEEEKRLERLREAEFEGQ